MYIRTTTRKNKDGTKTQYVQLAHNEWLKESKRSDTKVLYNFGRREEVDIESLERLVKSIQKFIGSNNQDSIVSTNESIIIESTKMLGGAWFLDQLWRRLELDSCLKHLLSGRGYEIPIERAIFAMVANRALDPGSKLSCEHWVTQEAVIPYLEDISVHQLYRSMDFLVDHDDEIQKEIFFSVASIINLEVDLIYFDTTSTYFDIDEPDGDDAGNETTAVEDASDAANVPGPEEEPADDTIARKRGHTKDHRSDLPQVVIGMAVTKEGIPIRCWVFSGNTSDVSIVGQVKKDLQGWRLNRVISVMDCGFASDDNFIKLQSGGGHFIIGEKMRSGKPEVEAALSKKGRYTTFGDKDSLFAKEAIVGDGERRKRYVIVYNPKEAEKDLLTRERHIHAIEEKIKSFGELTGKAHTKAVCALVSHRTQGRYVRTLKSGGVALDKAAIAAEKRLDGKYLIHTSDDTLSIEDIVLGYKQLKVIERGFRTLKTELELRPVYHRRPQRIKAHVLLCFLALLLIRVAENETGDTWFHLHRELKKLSLVTLKMPERTVRQTTETTARHREIMAKCKLKLPPKIWSID